MPFLWLLAQNWHHLENLWNCQLLVAPFPLLLLPICSHICLYFYFKSVCISSACFHQIFPNASDQISLALFCTFREKGCGGEEGGGGMQGAGYLPLCGCLGNTRMRSHPRFPHLPSTSPSFHPPSLTKRDYIRAGRICGNLWHFTPGRDLFTLGWIKADSVIELNRDVKSAPDPGFWCRRSFRMQITFPNTTTFSLFSDADPTCLLFS